MKSRQIVSICVLLVFFTGLSAETTSADRSKTVRAVRVGTAPVIDGKLDDPVWQQAAVIDEIHQVDPHEYEDPSERTVFYLMYDADNLYIGARAWDSEPERITAQVLKQGEALFIEDRVGVILDPFNDKRSGYMFEMNPNGVRLDGLFNSPTEFRPWWDGIWHGEAEMTGDGYTVEFAIPFKTLSFDTEDETWGLNVWREVMRNDEKMGWVSHNRSYNPAASGEMTGMKDMNIGMGLDIVPSMSMIRHQDHQTGDSGYRLEPSLDVAYRLTPGLNSQLTFNTDFSATEVDDRQVNLSRFSLFFPEKRDFFLKDSDIFEFGNTGNESPFFSRRIGLSRGGEPIDLEIGGKISGRVGQWNLGALAIRQAAYRDVDASNLMVARVSRNILTESSVGAIMTYGDPTSNLDNVLGGVDFRYLNTRLPNGRVISGELWYQQTHTEGLSGEDYAWGAGIHMPNRNKWYGNLRIKEFHKNYNPALGFITRRGVRDTFANIGYIHRPQNIDWLREISTGINFRNVTRLNDDKMQTQFMMFELLDMANFQGDRLQLRFINIKEGLEDTFFHPLPAKDIRAGKSVPLERGLYRFNRYGIWLQTSASRKISGFMEIFNGEYYSGKRFSAEGRVTWRPNKHFSLSGSYDYNDFKLKQTHFITRLMTMQADIVFSNTLSWTNLLQFDNISDNLGVNSRLHWNPRAGRDFYLVINYNAIDTENGFRSLDSDITLKGSYIFRF